MKRCKHPPEKGEQNRSPQHQVKGEHVHTVVSMCLLRKGGKWELSLSARAKAMEGLVLKRTLMQELGKPGQ